MLVLGANMSWNIESPTAEYYDHESKGLESLVKEIIDTPEVAIDTETTGLVIWKDLPLYWSLGWGERRATLNVSALHYFKEAFEDADKRWIFANAKYDAHILANVGINIAGSLIDTQVMHSLLYDDHKHNLKYMCKHLLDWTWSDFQDTFGKIGKKQSAEELIKKAERENFGLLVEYAANDSWGTWQVYLELQKQLENAATYSLFTDDQPGIHTLWDLFDKIERRYTKVLWKTERRGILINQEYLEQIEPIARKELQSIEKAIAKKVGKAINPNSPAQLRDYFFGTLGMKATKMTDGGKTGNKQPALGAKELEKIDHPVAELVMNHRRLKKLYGTYITGISALLDPHGRIHTTLNQDIARTGRLSSKNPNLQNIPNPEKDKWNLRNAFITTKGWSMPVADYSQLEMRLLACASNEASMIEIIKKGWDIHIGNASLIFGHPYEDIKEAKKISKSVELHELPASALTALMKEYLAARGAAKTIGFGLIYGMGVKKMAKDLNLTQKAAKEKMNKFMKTYPAVGQFKEEAIRESQDTGYTFTILGRRRNNANINSHHGGDRSLAERIAVNTQIQGSAADVVKMAQIRLDDAKLDERFDCHSILQVHDEVALECPDEAVPEVMPEIVGWMMHPFSRDLAVELAVDINAGKTWHESK